LFRFVSSFSHQGRGIFHKFGHLGHALAYAYPEVEWDLGKFSIKGKKSGQRLLRVKIEEMIPGIDIVEDYKHPELNLGNLFFSVFSFNSVGKASARPYELDLWLPSYEIGIEYQGKCSALLVIIIFQGSSITSILTASDLLGQ
jgi:hypothetical protein